MAAVLLFWLAWLFSFLFLLLWLNLFIGKEFSIDKRQAEDMDGVYSGKASESPAQ